VNKDLIAQKLKNLDRLVFQMRMDLSALERELLPSASVKIETGLNHQDELPDPPDGNNNRNLVLPE
jgi:hypothetical protein